MPKYTRMTFGQRELVRRSGATLEVHVALKRDARVLIGFWLMRLGARLAGMAYRQERP